MNSKHMQFYNKSGKIILIDRLYKMHDLYSIFLEFIHTWGGHSTVGHLSGGGGGIVRLSQKFMLFFLKLSWG